jgi:hypothetical protein
MGYHDGTNYIKDGGETIGFFNYYPGPTEEVEPYIQWIMDPNNSPWRKVLGEDVQAFYSKQFKGWCVFVGNIDRISSPAVMSFLKTSRLWSEHNRDRYRAYVNAGLSIPIAYLGEYMLPSAGHFQTYNVHGSPIPGALNRPFIHNFLNGEMKLGKASWRANHNYNGTDVIFGAPTTFAAAKQFCVQFLVAHNAPVDPNQPVRKFGNIQEGARPLQGEYNFDQCVTILKGIAKEFGLEDQ